MKSLTRAIATMVNLTRFHWRVNGKELTYEALFSLTNDNSVPEDLLLGNVIKNSVRTSQSLFPSESDKVIGDQGKKISCKL